jgi:UDP-glucose 4-epimerase
LYRDNVLDTANVLQYCLESGVKHLIFASTQAVYGMPLLRNNHGRINEYTGYEPLEYYAHTKAHAEQLLKFATRQGLNITCLRLPGVYGGDRRTGFIYEWIKQAHTRREIQVESHYRLPINVLHIEDVVDAFTKAASGPAIGWRALNISDGQRSGLHHLADSVANAVTMCSVKASGIKQPMITVNGNQANTILNWHPKPRKERLAQVLEEIRRGT